MLDGHLTAAAYHLRACTTAPTLEEQVQELREATYLLLACVQEQTRCINQLLASMAEE